MLSIPVLHTAPARHSPNRCSRDSCFRLTSRSIHDLPQRMHTQMMPSQNTERGSLSITLFPFTLLIGERYYFNRLIILTQCPSDLFRQAITVFYDCRLDLASNAVDAESLSVTPHVNKPYNHCALSTQVLMILNGTTVLAETSSIALSSPTQLQFSHP